MIFVSQTPFLTTVKLFAMGFRSLVFALVIGACLWPERAPEPRLVGHRQKPVGRSLGDLSHTAPNQYQDLVRFAKQLVPGKCFTSQMRVGMILLWKHTKDFLVEYRVAICLCSVVFALFFIVKRYILRPDFGYSVLHQFPGEASQQWYSKTLVAYSTVLWLFDMLSDIYVTAIYFHEGMMVYGSMLIGIWLLGGCLGFAHRLFSWKRCDIDANVAFWAADLNAAGEPKPGIKSFILYLLQVQPILMAHNSWSTGVTKDLEEETVLTALCEGAPSSLLQIYALLLHEPKGNPFVLSASIAMSILTVANGINKAFDLCKPRNMKVIPGTLPQLLLTLFRW